MAVKKRIESMDVRLYPDVRYHLEWYKEDVPAPYRDYYSVFYRGEHVAEIFRGKSALYGIVFEKLIRLRGGTLYNMGLHIAGMFVNTGN